MPAFRRPLLAACATLLLGAAAPARPVASTPVVLTSAPGSPADAIARRVMADDLEAARTRSDKPLVLTGRGAIGAAQPALFVQLQSEQECGSAGCSTSVFSAENGKWQRVLDSATGKLAISAKKTQGRNDIVSEDDHFVWNGKSYVSLVPAPAIDLKPKSRPAKH